MTDLRDNSGNSAKAVLVDPNNASIAQYNPQGIDDPHSYRAREGFIGINDLWADNSGTVYLQGHLVIPNDWGNVSTNGTTTTTTDDTTAKGGGDEAEPCGLFDNKCYNSKCFADCWKGKTHGRNWNDDKQTIGKYLSLSVVAGLLNNISSISAAIAIAIGGAILLYY